MNCKPGDLAIIAYAAGRSFDWIGRIVEVGTLAGNDEKWGAFWNISFVGEEPDSCRGRICECYDSDLYPVSGLPMEEETQETIKEKA